MPPFKYAVEFEEEIPSSNRNATKYKRMIKTMCDTTPPVQPISSGRKIAGALITNGDQIF